MKSKILALLLFSLSIVGCRIDSGDGSLVDAMAAATPPTSTASSGSSTAGSPIAATTTKSAATTKETAAANQATPVASGSAETAVAQSTQSIATGQLLTHDASAASSVTATGSSTAANVSLPPTEAGAAAPITSADAASPATLALLPPPPLLSLPPSVAGSSSCYADTGSGWGATGCSPPPASSSDPIRTTTTSSQPAIESPNVPLTFAQAFFEFEAIGSDVSMGVPNSKKIAIGAQVSDTLSLQINTNSFPCAGGHTCWVQFVFDYNPNNVLLASQNSNNIHIEVWTDVRSQSGDNFTVTVPLPAHFLQPGDAVNLGAFIDPVTGNLIFVAQTLWKTSTGFTTNSFSVTTDTSPGSANANFYATNTADPTKNAANAQTLANIANTVATLTNNNWLGVSGVLVGEDDSEMGVFTKTKVLSQIAAFSASAPTASQLNDWTRTCTGCLDTADGVLSGETGESSNLMLWTQPQLLLDTLLPNLANVTNGVYTSFLLITKDIWGMQPLPQLPPNEDLPTDAP